MTLSADNFLLLAACTSLTHLTLDDVFENGGASVGIDLQRERAFPATQLGYAYAVGLGDLDGDGDPDLYVTNYVDWSEAIELDCRNRTGRPDYCPPARYDAPTRDVLYRNEGDGTFVDVSFAAAFAGHCKGELQCVFEAGGGDEARPCRGVSSTRRAMAR